jgi:ABC-type lipoprotein release transport system permease subunit
VRRASVISSISVVGIVIGVTALTVVSGITGGFQLAFRERILGLYPHLIIMKRASTFEEYREVAHAVRTAPGVAGASPSTYGEMLAAVGERRSGLAIKGVEASTTLSVSRLDMALVEGTADALSEVPSLALRGDALHVDGVVAGTSYTLFVTDDGPTSRAYAVEDPLARTSLLGLAGVRLVHLAPGQGPLWLSNPAAAEEQPAIAEALGKASRLLEGLDGAQSLRIQTDGGATWAEEVAILKAGQTRSVIALEDANGTPRVVVLDEPGPNLDGPAEQRAMSGWLRVVDLRAQPRALELVVDGVPTPHTENAGVGRHVGVAGRLPRILLGIELFKRLEARRGDVLTLVSPLRGVESRALGPLEMEPTSGRFEVAGAFRSGFWEYDVRLALVELRASQRFVGRGDLVQWVDARLEDDFGVKDKARDVLGAVEGYGLDDFAKATRGLTERLTRLHSGEAGGVGTEPPKDSVQWLAALGQSVSLVARGGLDLGRPSEFKAIDWEEMNHNLLSALKLQKVVLTIFFLIIIAVAAFNIVGSQVMLIHEKRADIAILKSMGATRSSLSRVFLIQGLGVSSVGTVLGLILGLGLLTLLRAVGYPLDPEVYLIDRLPVEIDVPEAVITALLALCFTCLTTLYSAVRAGRFPPVQGLRRLD